MDVGSNHYTRFSGTVNPDSQVATERHGGNRMTENNKPRKRFDDFPKKDCNDCANYWTSSCDGVRKGSERLCNSFVAQRSVDIPARIESLRGALKWLRIALIILSGFVLWTWGYILSGGIIWLK